MAEFALHLKKWRCGRGTNERYVEGETDLSTVTSLGTGSSCLLNSNGYMCCLGQFAEQAGVPRYVLLNTFVPGRSMRQHSGDDPRLLTDNLDELISANDAAGLSVQRRIEKIRTFLENEGHTLKVIV